jgi:hypothetical protein
MRGWLVRPVRLLRPDHADELAPPDLWIDVDSPSLFTVYRQIPDPVEHTRETRQRVNDLFEAHAIDEGTPRILDEGIEAVADMWKGQVKLEHLERQRASAFQIARLEAQAKIRGDRVAELEKRLERVEAAISVAAEPVTERSRRRRRPEGGETT